MSSKIFKILIVILLFLSGFSVSTFSESRIALEQKINDSHREILISARLLKVYTTSCDINSQKNFSPYVEHSVTKYSFLVSKAKGFPYFINGDFIYDHEESAFEIEEEIKENKAEIAECS